MTLKFSSVSSIVLRGKQVTNLQCTKDLVRSVKGQSEKTSHESCSKLTATDGRGKKVKLGHQLF